MDNGKLVEFVESCQPPIPKKKKWVLIISTMYGCPVKCRFCDSGGYYSGKLSKEEIFSQIDFLVDKFYPNSIINVDKFKIQFARMGEPALNPSVLDVLKELPERYNAPGLLPSISSIAPCGSETFFTSLEQIKDKFYRNNFQLQFSIHSTDEKQRNWLIPVKKWSFGEIAHYGSKFYTDDEKRKVTLNFALSKDSIIEPEILLQYFSPEQFLIKITPVNPTYRSFENGIASYIQPGIVDYPIITELKNSGYDVILSIGEFEENKIGSNCGQYIMNYMRENSHLENSYTYNLDYVVEEVLV